MEDTESDQILTIRALRRANLINPIDVVHDGVEALDYLRATGRYADRDPGVLPAFVLLDLNLPRIGGIEVLRQVRADDRLRALPVVILTSSHDDAKMIEGHRLGVNAYVRKPFGLAELVSATASLGLSWSVLADENQRSA